MTGSTGFVGRNVLKYLLERGHSVTCLMRPENDEPRLDGFEVRKVWADPFDVDSIRKNVNGIANVLHFAGLSESGDEEALVRSNVEYTYNLALAFSERKERERFLYISSQSAFRRSPRNRPGKEGDAAKPEDSYGRSKLKAENALKKFSQFFRVWVLRTPPIYGPWNKGLLHLWEDIAKVREIRIRRDYPMSLLHMFDLCWVIGRIVEKSFGDQEKGWNLYFITDGEEHTLKQICETAAKTLDREPHFVEGMGKWLALKMVVRSLLGLFSERYDRHAWKYYRKANYSMSCDKARREIGYQPMYTLEKGLDQVFTWYKENGWLQ